MNKIFFFDLDGTLSSPIYAKIPQSAMDAIKKLQSLGYPCIVCTGRSYAMAKEFPELDEMSGIIYSNGGGFYHQGKLVYRNDIAQNVIDMITENVEKYHGGYQLLAEDGAWQNETETKNYRNIYKTLYPGLDIDKQLAALRMYQIGRDYVSKPIQKIDVSFFTEEDEQAFLKTLPEDVIHIPTGDFNKTKLHIYGHELMPAETNKGEGVRRTIAYFNFDPVETYAFGDSYNDVLMMKACDHAIVMGNGDEPVKKMAEFVTDTVDNDGIAKAIAKIFQ